MLFNLKLMNNMTSINKKFKMYINIFCKITEEKI